MKVILRTDVENLGRLGDLVEVKPGYGRNFLLPQGLAMLATPSNLKVFELERKKLQEKTNALRAEAADLATRIASINLAIPMRVGENNKLYGSVTSFMIVDALEEKGITVDRRRVLLDSPLRVLGDYTIRIRLHADVVAELALSIVAERSVHADEQEVIADAKQESAEAETAAE